MKFRDEESYAKHVASSLLPRPSPLAVAELRSDVIEDSDGYSDIVECVTGRINALALPPHNLRLTVKQHLARVLISWLCLPRPHEKLVLNEATLCKLLLGEEARAHIDGVYVTECEVWRRQPHFWV